MKKSIYKISCYVIRKVAGQTLGHFFRLISENQIHFQIYIFCPPIAPIN